MESIAQGNKACEKRKTIIANKVKSFFAKAKDVINGFVAGLLNSDDSSYNFSLAVAAA